MALSTPSLLPPLTVNSPAPEKAQSFLEKWQQSLLPCLPNVVQVPLLPEDGPQEKHLSNVTSPNHLLP